MIINLTALLLCFLELSSASQIVFLGSPLGVKDGLTGALTLRCSLNDTAVSGTLIGRSVTSPVTSTLENVEQVSSIVITHGGQDVASVAQSHPAKVIGRHAKVTGQQGTTAPEVSGTVTGKTRERGFLQLTYIDPNANSTGEFTCEVNALTSAGHVVVLSSSLEVTVSQPTMADLVTHIRQLEREKVTMQQTIHDLQSQGRAGTHSESGLVECGDSAQWAGRHGLFTTQSRYTDKVIKFRKAYGRPPTVTAAVAEMDDSNAHNSRFRVTVPSVTATSFTVRCETWVDSQIYRMAVSWISIL